ncbi:hypothetical protein [Staphylococcus delphini]|uniref:hypothetical protein n=1 Tax=Staphylococcus delphini TaxID=53344 RepID=UPI0021D2A8EF|nr:hypothetical protein [Staphylococcus delphini]UXS36207.1 hypothetical protein MUA34_09185 [Staphylococcus delphini]UXS43617.1 hypothetical protein MUA39_09630 [Staphylococcus delphini]UXV44311.1 hypothetical protein MUA63_09605 [Staphylococcus delphini]
MNKLFKVSALSVSLGLAGLLGTQAQAAEETLLHNQTILMLYLMIVTKTYLLFTM